MEETLRVLNLIDEYEYRAIREVRRLNSNDVIDTFSDAMIRTAFLNIYVRTTAPEFVTRNLRRWVQADGAKTLYIETDFRER